MKNFISENGGVLVLMAMGFTIGAAYLEWRIEENTEAAIHDAGSVTPEELAAAIKDIANNAEDIGKLETSDQLFQQKIDRIVEILLED